MSRLTSALLLAAAALPAQPFGPALYSAMRWRQIGPFRAGRVSAVAGIPGDAAVYYMGTPGGGVWKTVDGGVVWPHLRPGARGLHRRNLRGAVQARDRLRRHR
jgi:hypothetical protein